jgi:ubiquinone/menaquinone biosynthesis C-methylase UbiE
MVMEQTRRNQHEFVWQTIPSLAELGRLRMSAMQRFLADYEGGKREGRYVEAALPTLPFADQSFDLALSSHFLFLYSEHFSESFHRAAIIEMCRVAQEVRIFPLLALGSRPSPYVDSISKSLSSAGIDLSIETVSYQFQRGGNQMMRLYGGEKREKEGKRGKKREKEGKE